MPVAAAKAFVGPQWLTLCDFDVASAFESLSLGRIGFLDAGHIPQDITIDRVL
jgi:hypothetical protein